MTSTTGAAGHPDVDELSDLTEGLLSRSRAAEVQRHLDGCADCSETYASLAEIHTLLGEHAVTTPMPADVAARIDAALAAEALSTSKALASSAEAESDAITDAVADAEGRRASPASAAGAALTRRKESLGRRPAGRRRGRVRVSRETSPVEGRRPSTRRPMGRPSVATGPSRQGRMRWGGTRKAITLGSVFTAVLLVLGAVVLQQVGDDSSSESPATASSARPSGTRHTFSAGTLQGEVDTLLQDRQGPGKQDAGASTPTPSLDLASPQYSGSNPHRTAKPATPLERNEPAVRVPDCIHSGIGRTEPPIAAERGIFEGTDAYLVVLPHATDQAMISAYVVDAACTQQPLGSSGTILLTRSYPRH